MSPQDMQSVSRCSATCPGCATNCARRRLIRGWVTIAFAFVWIGFSFPVDGLLGVALVLAGIALVWRGCHLIVRPQGGDR